MPNKAIYLNFVKCNRTRAINLLREIIYQLRNIYNDDDGYFFYFGYCDDIENLYNREIINNYKDKIKDVFKYNKNWDNLFNSPNMVANILKWCFTIILKTYPCPFVYLIDTKHNLKYKKYYIPNCII